MADEDSRGLPLVSDLTAAIGREIVAHDPRDPVPWPELPTVEAMTLHVGNVHRWVTAIVRTRSAVDMAAVSTAPGADVATWYAEGRTALLGALAAAPTQDPCWVLGRRPGTVGFWHRRMVYENVKHLMDLRASGGRFWMAAEELSTADYADGIDEMFEVFLPRSRSRLAALPAPVLLRADDSDRRWCIDREWGVSSSASTRSPSDIDATQISARTSDLALALWERADLRDRDRFVLSGGFAAVEALATTRIHPW